MAQRYYAPKQMDHWPNGAQGFGCPGFADCIGPFAKVRNCPVDGAAKRYTVYATGPADTFFSVPACTRIAGRHVKGFLHYVGTNPLLDSRPYGPEFVPSKG